MNRSFLWLAVLLSSVPVIFGQTKKSGYLGQQTREIKALSAQEIQGYLSGQGMGFAKSAELNHYPGPKHVLELANELDLSPQQKEQTEKIYSEMHAEAVRLGQSVVDLEENLDRQFSERRVDEEQLQTIISKLSKRRGELRFVHLNAHLKMTRVLLAQQILKYDEQRGYRKSEHHHPNVNH